MVGATATSLTRNIATSKRLRLGSSSSNGNGNAIQTIGFSYDEANRRTKTTYANGIVASYSYDVASQLTGITYKKADGTLIGDLTYTYDADGQRTGMGGSLARVDPGTAVSTTQFNANNQLVKWNTQSLSYDANGNLTSDGTNTYTWDERNQLRGISGAVTASFQYDAIGRRVSKVIGSNATGYLYDGASFVQEKNAGAVTANLLNGPSLICLHSRRGNWCTVGIGLGWCDIWQSRGKRWRSKVLRRF